MRKIVLFIHTSLDGYAVSKERKLDWIHVDQEIFDYAAERTNKSDTALYGRITYEMMEGYWPTAGDKPNASKHDKEHSAWYNAVNKVILSKSMRDAKLKNTIIISDDIQKHILELKQKEGKEIIIFGSPSAAHSLMQFDLIDNYWLFVNPVLLGNGIPVFGNISQIKKLKLIDENAFSSGVVCLHYEKRH